MQILDETITVVHNKYGFIKREAHKRIVCVR